MVPKQSPALQYEAESPWIEWWVTHKGLTIHPLMPCGWKRQQGSVGTGLPKYTKESQGILIFLYWKEEIYCRPRWYSLIKTYRNAAALLPCVCCYFSSDLKQVRTATPMRIQPLHIGRLWSSPISLGGLNQRCPMLSSWLPMLGRKKNISS